ncbi:MAG: hypothetical protein KDC49_06035 [Saprospiraceae bacterium]|nr:hypothetical protein [Saprospiraceae bacterium]
MIRKTLAYLAILTLIILFLPTCKAGKSAAAAEMVVQYADSIQAIALIQENDRDGFFDLIQVTDMAIQMHALPPYPDRAVMLEKYKAFLAGQVKPMEPKDKIWLDSTFLLVKKGIKDLNPKLAPPAINIVKIRTDHYGEGTFYTRGYTIFIPDHIFNENFKEHVNVMYHELWHIISRNNKDIKTKAYQLIGFEPHGKSLKIADSLQQIILTNPDGCVNDYALNLKGETIIPIIHSKYKAYNPMLKEFFEYLSFDFFPIDEQGRVGNVPAKLGSMEGLYDKIKDNTQYIIHPDEIMADNFRMCINSNQSGDYSMYSTGGKQLIQDFTQLLKEVKKVD